MRGSEGTMEETTTHNRPRGTLVTPVAAVAHLEALLARAPAGYGLVVSGRHRDATGWARLVPFLVTLDRVDEAVGRVKALGHDFHVYTSVAAFHPDAFARIAAGGNSKRGSEGDVGALVALWADLDIAKEGHHSPHGLPLPPNEAAALATIAHLPPPSFVTATGGGLHPYWLLADPLVVDGPDTLTVARDLAEGWGRNLAHHAATRFGWHLDNVGDLPRVLRLAGTRNPKTDPAPRVGFHSVGEGTPGLVDARPWTPGPAYDWRELANLVATQAPPPLPAPPPKPKRERGTVDTSTGPKLDILTVLDEVAWEDLWPDGWTFVGHETVRDKAGGSEVVELWKRPGGTSPASAKCWPGGGCRVWTDQLDGLPAGKYSRAEVYAWTLGFGSDLSALSRALVKAGRGAK